MEAWHAAISFCRLSRIFFVPTHLWGEELYTQMGFFVQLIFADRYIHRREMWVVSLKSCSSVKFKIKKITNFLESSGMNSLTKFAIYSVMSIKWTYLVLWVDSYWLLSL